MAEQIRLCSVEGFALIDIEKFQALCSTSTWHVSRDGEILLGKDTPTGLYFHGNDELTGSPPTGVPQLEEPVIANGTNQLLKDLERNGVLNGALIVKYFNEEKFSLEAWHKGVGGALTRHQSHEVSLCSDPEYATPSGVGA